MSPEKGENHEKWIVKIGDVKLRKKLSKDEIIDEIERNKVRTLQTLVKRPG